LKENNKLFLAYRRQYLLFGLQNLDWLTAEQQKRLDQVLSHKEKADEAVDQLLGELQNNGGIATETLIRRIKDYCREIFLGTEQIQEIWKQTPEAPKLLTQMYHYLYGQVPPRFLLYLHETYGENRPEDRVGLKKYRADYVMV
jgi:hypothetical protein